MSITTQSPNLPLYTLLRRDVRSNETIICTYGHNGAILTSDYDALIEHAASWVLRDGIEAIYTISRVTEHLICNVLEESYK
jgi:hypothetical protein